MTIQSLRFPFRFARLLRDGGYDVINTEPQLLSGLIVWLAARLRVPVRIVTIHNSIGDPGQTARSRIVRTILSHRLFVWAMRSLITRHATRHRRFAKRSRQRAPRSLAVLRFQLPWSTTAPIPLHLQPSEAGDVRREFGWPPDSRIVVNVGRFSDQKNHAAILETMRLVHERDPLVRLLLVGGGSLRDDIERRIDRLGIRAVSALTSNRSDMGRLLAASDVFFFPSAWEGLPGAPLEALAAGLPLVASDIPSMREIAAYFPGDISMAPPNDTRQHAENIRRALDEPIDGARSRRQRRFASSPFTLETALATYGELYGLDSHESQAEAPSSAERTLLFGAGVLALRKDDFLLAGFPRSGSTWTRHVLCNLISLNEWSGREVEAVLNETMPALGASNLFRPWPHSTIPRVIKTHHRYSPLFRNIPSIGSSAIPATSWCLATT